MFFLTEEAGIGAVKMSNDKRLELAVKSREFCCKECGPIIDHLKFIGKQNE